MAKIVITKFVDDLDNEITEDVQTVRFSINDRTWEIDLGEANFEALYNAMERFIDGATETTVKRKASKRAGVPAKEIRAWAVKAGHELSSRGAIPKEVIAAYNDANGTNY